MIVRRTRPGRRQEAQAKLQTGIHIVVFGGSPGPKLDQDPFKDIRVRRAIAHGGQLAEVLETNAWSLGHGVAEHRGAGRPERLGVADRPAAAEGRRLYEHDTAGGQAAPRRGGPSATAQVPPGDHAPATARDYVDAVQIGAQELEGRRASTPS